MDSWACDKDRESSLEVTTLKRSLQAVPHKACVQRLVEFSKKKKKDWRWLYIYGEWKMWRKSVVILYQMFFKNKIKYKYKWFFEIFEILKFIWNVCFFFLMEIYIFLSQRPMKKIINSYDTKIMNL